MTWGKLTLRFVLSSPFGCLQGQALRTGIEWREACIERAIEGQAAPRSKVLRYEPSIRPSAYSVSTQHERVDVKS